MFSIFCLKLDREYVRGVGYVIKAEEGENSILLNTGTCPAGQGRVSAKV